MSPHRETAVGGPEGTGQQWRPSHGLEHPGLGKLSHRAEQDAGQGGADRGAVTRGKQSGHKHGDRRAGSRSRQVPRDASGQEERGRGCGDEDDDSADQYEADGSQATSTERGGVDGEGEPRCTKSTTHVGRANSGGRGRGWWGKRRQGSGLRRDTLCAAQCPTSLTQSPASRWQ